MNGEVFLIRISSDRIVPALCLLDENGEYCFAQIRKGNIEKENIIIPPKPLITKSKKGRHKKRQKEDEPKKEKKIIVDSINIGQPQGLKSESVVMLKKLHYIKNDAIIKRLATISSKDFEKCLLTYKEIKRMNDLHQELHKIKRRIQLAQLNNEKYGDLEKKKDQTLKAIGYSNKSLIAKEKKPYLNYREVPDKGRIKVYRG
ncbi:hypothetical protein [Planococcus sp. ISL-110]|uniref:hypothetical protein n=1 Tax=Planococcus sp. ISL-110 TaxID=2819167 RepID=UPI001BE98742|nr:hypothetical protein [Planococcus sp. ISL-110]MBT2572334.1 hypothetical protein [Planococcus sp. ISL-110]